MVVAKSDFIVFWPELISVMKRYNDGLRFKKLVVLAGERPLDPIKEPATIFYDRKNCILPIREDFKEPAELPKTEADMAHVLFDQVQWPVDFKEIVEIEFVDTGDTVKHWLLRNPRPGSVLSISNQPYVRYQHAVLKTLLPSTFELETMKISTLL